MGQGVLRIIALAGVTSPAAAQFLVPDGVNAPWTRGVTTPSAFADWNIFTSPVGPNTPNASSATGTFAPGAGAWNVFDTSGDSFVTGTGSIYSIFTRTRITVEVPSFGLGEGFQTTIWLQLQTLGTEFDPATMNVGGEEPVEIRELDRENLGPPGPFGGGFRVDTLVVFELPGNAPSYDIRFDAEEGSMSLDRVIVDQYVAATGPTPCSVADFSAAFGELDINDILTFAADFDSESPRADISPDGGDGDIDINDILVFAEAFDAGCP